MTRYLLLASTFVLGCTVSASAQFPVPPAPAPPAAPIAVAPVAIAPEAPFPPDIRFDFNYDFNRITSDAKAISLAFQKPLPAPPGSYMLGKLGEKGGSEESWYSQARSYIERDQYDRAVETLDRVITAGGDRADAAMYWKAYSLSKLARRPEALTTLSDLQKRYAKSRWVPDAKALEIEVRQASGQGVSPDGVTDDLKLYALQSIMRNDPETALPAVEKMLAGGSSVRVKERALFVVSQSREARAKDILVNVARGGSNPDLQMSAIRYLGMSNNAEAATALASIYNSDSSVDARKAVISALAMNRNSSATLITMARAEKNPELKDLMVRRIADMRTPEARAYMLEILSK
jgi:tetratricopeptide (TPR) repeat protein